MATYWENSCSFGLRYVSWYKYLIVSLVFSHLGFWSGNLFLIAPFPDLCLLVPSCNIHVVTSTGQHHSVLYTVQGRRYNGCRSLAYRPADRTLVMGFWNDNMLVLQLATRD